MSEEEIIQGCIEKNQVAQEALYNKYAPKMLAVSYSYSRNTAEAEDILQDAFIKVFNYIGSYNGKGALGGWIRRIVVNESLNKIRSGIQFESSDENTYPEPFVEEDVLKSMHFQEILSLIQKLPNGYKVVFNLYVLEGFSHQEIAEELNITVGTSRSQLNKARKMLQQWICVKEKINL